MRGAKWVGKGEGKSRGIERQDVGRGGGCGDKKEGCRVMGKIG